MMWHGRLARDITRKMRVPRAQVLELNCFELDCIPDVINLIGKSNSKR